jgi:hypothetical protein
LKAEDIRKFSTTDTIPEQLKIYVSQEVWNMWSPIRRDSFTKIIKNPNTFFYRNRPPGDPQRTGPFSQEEEEQFINRLRYFRDVLGIEDGLWGLFAVPIKGRLGYQCSNFYRLLIQQGKVHDDRYQLVDGKLNFIHGQRKPIDDSVMEMLTKEAFDFIENCLKTEEGEAPMMEKPVRIAPPVRVTQKDKVDVKKKSDGDEEEADSSPIPNRFQQMHRRRTFYIEDNSSPLCGAIDPVSKKPIKAPMMDEDGYVMDLSSWRQYFKDEISVPFQTRATSEANLLQITQNNYAQFRKIIVNIPC